MRSSMKSVPQPGQSIRAFPVSQIEGYLFTEHWTYRASDRISSFLGLPKPLRLASLSIIDTHSHSTNTLRRLILSLKEGVVALQS